MKKFILFLICILITNIDAFSQTTKYLDEDANYISKQEFTKKLKKHDYFEVPHDSLPNHMTLIPMLVQGKLSNKEGLLMLLEKATGDSINRELPTVILYHPSKDSCNSTGNNTKKYLTERHKQFEMYMDSLVGGTKPIYIYKEHTGLDRYRGIMNWYKDPMQIIENTFFKHHYPCGSYVVIGKDNTYVSYKGEYALGKVVDTAVLLNKVE